MAKYTSQIKAKTGETTNVFISQRERRRGYRFYRWWFSDTQTVEVGYGEVPLSDSLAIASAALWHRLDEPALTERDWLVKAFASSNTGDARNVFDGGDGWFSKAPDVDSSSPVSTSFTDGYDKGYADGEAYITAGSDGSSNVEPNSDGSDTQEAYLEGWRFGFADGFGGHAYNPEQALIEFGKRTIKQEHYLGVLFDRRVIVNYYDMLADEFSPRPSTWVFQGSNDGNGWNGLHIVTDFDWEPYFFDDESAYGDEVSIVDGTLRFRIEHLMRMV